jgi:hypothetical protein
MVAKEAHGTTMIEANAANGTAARCAILNAKMYTFGAVADGYMIGMTGAWAGGGWQAVLGIFILNQFIPTLILIRQP